MSIGIFKKNLFFVIFLSLDFIARQLFSLLMAFFLKPKAPNNFDELNCTQIQSGIERKTSRSTMERMPFLQDMFHGIGLLGSAAGIISAVDDSALKSIGEFLETMPHTENGTLQAEEKDGKLLLNNVEITQDELDRLEHLFARRSNSDQSIEEKDLVTFADLELLKRLDTSGAHHFRDLTLTGWDATDEKEIYFNAQNYPDMPIAYATRITMALPGAFKRVDLDLSRFQREFTSGQVHKLFDGGLGSNSPSEVFVKPLSDDATEEERLQYQKMQQETLTCIFDDKGIGFSAESFRYNYSENIFIRFFLWLLGAVKSVEKMKELRNGENEKLDDISNVFVVGHGHLGTLSMHPSPEDLEAANLMSALQASEWCRQRRDQVGYLESENIELLRAQIPEGRQLTELPREKSLRRIT